MPKLNHLIEQYGPPDILIDSFNQESQRYAVWGFDEVLELKDKGLFLNDSFINEDFEIYIQETINRWKEESQESQIACIGFLAYEFKNYLYKHINFQNKLNNSFPYFWFCKPKIIKEYELDFVELSSHYEYNLELERDILDLSSYRQKIAAIKFI